MRSVAAKMRPLGGHARTTASRQTAAAATAPASTTMVIAHAPINPRCGRSPPGTEVVSRSIAVVARAGGADADAGAASPASSADAAPASAIADASGATAAGSGGDTVLSAWAIGDQVLAQRAQRTIFPNGSRASGTSYVASQLGQAIRMSFMTKGAQHNAANRPVFQRDSRWSGPVMASDSPHGETVVRHIRRSARPGLPVVGAPGQPRQAPSPATRKGPRTA